MTSNFRVRGLFTRPHRLFEGLGVDTTGSVVTAVGSAAYAVFRASSRHPGCRHSGFGVGAWGRPLVTLRCEDGVGGLCEGLVTAVFASTRKVLPIGSA